MNSKVLQYAIELSVTRNFSQVSEKLNISQPTLSKHIQNLEKELGLKIFDRNTVPFTLTPAGEYFIHQAQALLYQEDQLLRSMEQFKSGEKGRLTIGVSPFRNLYLMPAIIKKIQAKFPGIQIQLCETNSTQLRKDAAEGKYDIAIVNLPVDESVLDIIPLESEMLVLAVPNEIASELPHTKSDFLPQLNFSDCTELPFVVVSHPQEMRTYFDKLCASAGFIPKIAVEVSGGVTTAWSMAHAGIGATLLPLQFVDVQNFDRTLTLFALKDHRYSRQPVIVTKRGQFISQYAQYAIELLTSNPI